MTITSTILLKRQQQQLYKLSRLGNSYLTRRCYKQAVNTLKKGQVVEFRNKPFKVLGRDNTSTGRGGAVVKVELQDLLSDNVKISERFKSNDSLEVLNVTDKTFQLLYTESGKLHLMNMESFEEVELPASTCENGEKGLQMLEDGMPLSVKYVTSPNDGEKPCSFKLPLKYTYTVESKVQRVKKDAKTASYTTATLTNGAKILVPDFINEGDKILVDLETMKYMRREN